MFATWWPQTQSQWTHLAISEGNKVKPVLNLLYWGLNWQEKTCRVSKLENRSGLKCPDPSSVRFAGRLITNNRLDARLLPYQDLN